MERAARRKREAEGEYEQAVSRAGRLGLAHRDVAAAAGVAHGTVRAILAPEPCGIGAGNDADHDRGDRRRWIGVLVVGCFAVAKRWDRTRPSCCGRLVTGKRRTAWEAVAEAAACAGAILGSGREGRNALGERLSDRLIDAKLRRAGCGLKNIAALVNHGLFDAGVTGLLAGLTLAEVADAMRVGWPELGTGGGPGQHGGLSSGRGTWIARICAARLPASANRHWGCPRGRFGVPSAGGATRTRPCAERTMVRARSIPGRTLEPKLAVEYGSGRDPGVPGAVTAATRSNLRR